MNQYPHFQDVTFYHAGRRFRLSRHASFHVGTHINNANQPVHVSKERGLIYIRQLLLAANIADLRTLLDKTDSAIASGNEDVIRGKIATLFLNGTLSLFETANSAASVQHTSSSKPESTTVEEAAPRYFQSPSDLLIEQQYHSTTTASSTVNSLDETAMAAVLVNAAQQGVALCERCEKQKN